MTEQNGLGVAPSLDPIVADAERAKALPLRLPVLDVPVLVPARMINELLYCERLMYLEWAQGEWADNYFTVDGKIVHRRVDGKAKPLKARAKSNEDAEEKPAEVDKPYTARSVWLSSERLGITAKIDVVDVNGGSVIPVEYKRGKQPSVAEGAYLPERAQLCAQVLLLREHGYQCESAEIYFAADRKRVPIAITSELERIVLDSVERARTIVQSETMPPPLCDSPKCQGCSLVGICLPDEVNFLTKEVSTESDTSIERSATEDDATAVRRLYPARDDRLPLYVNEQGAWVGLTGERLTVRLRDGSKVEARLPNTSQVALYGNVQISAQALRELITRNIPVTFFSYGGWFVGRTVGADGKNVELKIRQFQKTQDPEFCRRFASDMVTSKILNCRTLLRRNHANPDAVALSELKQLSRKATEASSIESLLGIEGTAARIYFGQFSGMLKGSAETLGVFDFQGRNRRPPTDPINALLSFCYSLLTKEFAIVLHAVGLDPVLGFYHQPHFGRPALALDLMEEFKPLIADSVVINAINTAVITDTDFVRAAGAVSLMPDARKRLILAYERRMDQLITHPLFDYRISYRRIIELQARLLGRLLLGEIPRYPTFRTR